MTDDASATKPSTADASADEAAKAPPNDETKPTSNEQKPPAKQSQLGQWVAVVAALIAAASAITSALVGANTSVSTVHLQSHASAVKAERDEKREAYANYVNSLYDLTNVELEAVNIISSYKLEDVTALNTEIGEFGDKFDTWTHLDGVTLLVDSTDVETTRNKLVRVHNAISELLFDTSQRVQRAANENRFNTVVPQIADLKNMVNEANNLQPEFSRLARKDLDNLGYGEH